LILASALCSKKSATLLIVNTLSGYDTVSSFAGKNTAL
jgi:hypothetical protein